VKALIQTDYGDPARVLALHDVPDAQAGAGQVVIDIEAAVVHAADARTVLGADGFRKKLPRTPGYEGVGRITAIGPDVKGLTLGTRVFAPLGSGTYRERIAVSADSLIQAPEGEAVQVALLSLSPATALLLMQDFVKLAPGDWILQNAANSPVGRMVIQLARELKVQVVNVVKSSPVIGELKSIGAGAVLLDTEDLRERVVAVTRGAPIRLALDAVAGEATARLANCVADDGTVVNYGAMSGQPCQIPTEMLGTRGIRLCGINPARQLARHTPEARTALFARIGKLLAARQLQARVAATYGLDRAIDAIRHALSTGDKRFGKVVIHIKDLPPPPAPDTDVQDPQNDGAAEPAPDSMEPAEPVAMVESA
jgi:trans-2-enoyl-CoA reductase